MQESARVIRSRLTFADDWAETIDLANEDLIIETHLHCDGDAIREARMMGHISCMWDRESAGR